MTPVLPVKLHVQSADKPSHLFPTSPGRKSGRRPTRRVPRAVEADRRGLTAHGRTGSAREDRAHRPGNPDGGAAGALHLAGEGRLGLAARGRAGPAAEDGGGATDGPGGGAGAGPQQTPRSRRQGGG